MLPQETGLLAGFLHSLADGPDREALHIDNTVFSYRNLARRAARLSAAIRLWLPSPEPVAAVFAHRSLTAYTGVLGVLMAGKGYVPLHPRFPAARTREMLRLSNANTIIVGQEALGLLEQVLDGMDRPLLVLCPDAYEVAASVPASTRIVCAGEIEKLADEPDPVAVSPDDCAYLLFTSGSTGTPKGVPVSQRNVTSYLSYVLDRYGITPEDRISQAFDLTFDLSVHDLFVTWSSGASLRVLPQAEVIAPAKFIHDHELTVWFSVPSVVMFLNRMHLLQPGSFKSLRLSLFCGEPLSATLASQWRIAAPNSIIENLYGPTEATIAISHYRWSDDSAKECRNGIVPIGQVFPSQQVAVIGEDRRILPDGSPGELCLSGSQVTRGYLNAPERTASQYFHLAGDMDRTWYRTGDLVVREPDGCIHFLGRVDHQVQVRGHRVELQEIECVVRRAAGTEMAVAIPHPVREGRAESIHVFLCGQANEMLRRDVLAECTRSLPDYMVPRSVRFLASMPLNANGKIDRKAVAQQLEAAPHELTA